MMRQGVVPGGGPREEWHGGKKWTEARIGKGWNSYDEGGQEASGSGEWNQFRRPKWMDTDLGEDVPPT